MKPSGSLCAFLMLCASLLASPALAQTNPVPSEPVAAQEQGETGGQHDFDFSIGTWRTEVRLLQHPLSGSETWVEYEGTSVVRKVWNGRANLVELDVEGPAGRIEGLNLRLYNPQSRQWSLHYANSRSGAMSPPVMGEFRNGRGAFYGLDTLDGRPILVRFVISKVGSEVWRFEQSFSGDGGKSWEANWIATDTRLEGEYE